ncbi:hypothetical protein [Natrinema sp. DC36]|uniref:hypothetical protein n=1 Tax=Natrinema sp. DC36 TaxID=2878680 RepID=UPI001CF0AF64|nr:hypothetical protein [Natrinema sp. DC36]
MKRTENLCDIRPVNMTILDGNDATNKQVSMPVWVHQLLSDTAKDGNRRMSQGVVAYESLLFTIGSFHDLITEYESTIDKQLVEQDIEPCTLNSIKSNSKSEIEEAFVSRVYEENEKRDDGNKKDPYGTQERVKIWIPPTVEEQAEFQRGWGAKVEEALLNITTSSYRDRQDRIECKRQLLKYLKDRQSIVDHPVADAIISKNTTDYNIPRSLMIRFSGDGLRWHEREDLSIDDIIKMQDTEQRLKQSEWNKRLAAFRTAHLNHSTRLVKHGAKKLFVDCWGLQSEKQQNKRFKDYIEKYSVEFKHPIAVDGFHGFNVSELAEEIYIDEDEVVFMNEMFKYFEEENSTSKISVSDISKTMYEAGLISTNPRSNSSQAYRKVTEKIVSLNSNHGIDRLKYIDKGRIYLSSHIE